MNSIHEMKFRRRFSINPYKTLRMKLGEMSCYKDWVNDRRGDPYPVITTTDREGAAIFETLPGARYRAENRTDRPLMKAWAQQEAPIPACATCPLYPECNRLSKCDTLERCTDESRRAALRSRERSMLAEYQRYLNSQG